LPVTAEELGKLNGKECVKPSRRLANVEAGSLHFFHLFQRPASRHKKGRSNAVLADLQISGSVDGENRRVTELAF
jgi:hypothetical protein